MRTSVSSGRMLSSQNHHLFGICCNDQMQRQVVHTTSNPHTHRWHLSPSTAQTTNKVVSPNRADVVRARKELAEENLAAHMHSHMLLQVLSVKEGSMAGSTLASWELHEDVKEGDAPVGSPAKVMLLHMLTPPTNRTFPPPLFTSLLASRGFGDGVPPLCPRTKCHWRCHPSGCSDLAAEGSSSAKLEEAGGQGDAKQQEAQIDLFLPPLLHKNMKPCCHLLIHQPDRSSKSRLPTRFHFSPNLISVLNYKLIMGYH